MLILISCHMVIKIETLVKLQPGLIGSLRSQFSGYPHSCVATETKHRRHRSIAVHFHTAPALLQACLLTVWHAYPTERSVK